jgi:hypothetical protein
LRHELLDNERAILASERMDNVRQIEQIACGKGEAHGVTGWWSSESRQGEECGRVREERNARDLQAQSAIWLVC